MKTNQAEKNEQQVGYRSQGHSKAPMLHRWTGKSFWGSEDLPEIVDFKEFHNIKHIHRHRDKVTFWHKIASFGSVEAEYRDWKHFRVHYVYLAPSPAGML